MHHGLHADQRGGIFAFDKLLGGWAKTQKKHFADGGVFDEIQKQEPTQ